MNKQEDTRDRILDLIEGLDVGHSIPSERQLTGDLGVSRLTVRAALDDLVRDGYLELAKWQRDRVVVIEGWKSPDDIEKEIWETLVKRFPELAAKSEINNQQSEI